MENKQSLNMELLESRTLFAGVDFDIGLGGGSGLISQLDSLLDGTMSDKHAVQNDSVDVACHSAEFAEEGHAEGVHAAKPVDKELDKKARKPYRAATSDFDWYLKGSHKPRIPEVKFSHESSESRTSSRYDSSDLTLANVASVTAEVGWEVGKILGEFALNVATVLNDHVIGFGQGTHRIKLAPMVLKLWSSEDVKAEPVKPLSASSENLSSNNDVSGNPTSSTNVSGDNDAFSWLSLI